MGRKGQTPEGRSRGCGLRSLRWRGGGVLLWLGWWLGGLGSLPLTGLPGRTGTHRTRKTGQYMLSKFAARGRQGSVWRWGRLLGKGRVASDE
jgi:hypothetical protein